MRVNKGGTMQATTTTVEAAIWGRVMGPQTNGFSPAAARAILKVGFNEEDHSRMHELAQKNREGTLSEAERQELEAYVKVGDVLSLLHLKARRSLNE
jgi:hypothetical protein